MYLAKDESILPLRVFNLNFLIEDFAIFLQNSH